MSRVRVNELHFLYKFSQVITIIIRGTTTTTNNNGYLERLTHTFIAVRSHTNVILTVQYDYT